jgi:pyruvate dehydrogenase E2 component (dihydrolipoamide acetyltransferase)
VAAVSGSREIRVPNIGEFSDLPVVEVLVAPGDAVAEGQALLTIESDKATMDVPSPEAGTVGEVVVGVGDTISEGTLILRLEAADGQAPPEPEPEPEPEAAEPEAPAPPPAPAEEERPPEPAPPDRGAPLRASPAVRLLARELGVDLGAVPATGPAGRLLKTDVETFVRDRLAAGTDRDGDGGMAPWPDVDFARFGPVETRPLSRLRRRAGANLHRNWVRIPHVTSHDEADITDLDAFRRRVNGERAEGTAPITLLAFLVRAAVAALQRFPEFNASLRGDELVLKRYHHIGFAADTPNGLVVPVIRDADRLGVAALAEELAALAARAREGTLSPSDMEGGTFTISSLGGIGGGAFTPIINAPEVAILGAGRAQTRPVWDGADFVPRLVLPLSLSWDHRVIDGAAAARFNAHLAAVLADVRRLLL